MTAIFVACDYGFFRVVVDYQAARRTEAAFTSDQRDPDPHVGGLLEPVTGWFVRDGEPFLFIDAPREARKIGGPSHLVKFFFGKRERPEKISDR